MAEVTVERFAMMHARCSWVRLALGSGALGLALVASAEERLLYKSVLPNGRVVYGDAPAAQARRSEKISVEAHPPNPEDTAAGLRALTLSRQQLLRDAAARSARLRWLDNQIGTTYAELQEANAQRESGREVQDGDRQGRRLAGAYFARQRALEAAALAVRRRLDALLRERSAVQY